MQIDLILTYEQSLLIALILPIIGFCLLYLFSTTFKGGSGRITKYLSYLVTPPTLNREDASGNAVRNMETSWRTDKVRIYFLYLGVLLFIVGFLLGEFYEVITDLALPVNQGSTDQYREAVSIVIVSLFRITWLGSLPWIGALTYHETWNWIFFTAAYTDNPAFLSSIVLLLILLSIGAGTVFLMPLASKSIRHSFLPSMFSLVAGMTIFSKASSSCLGYAIALLFFNAELEYITLSANGTMIPGLPLLILVMFFVSLLTFGLFQIIGRRLWRIFYKDSKSLQQFSLYLGIVFLLGVLFTIVLV